MRPKINSKEKQTFILWDDTLPVGSRNGSSEAYIMKHILEGRKKRSVELQRFFCRTPSDLKIMPMLHFIDIAYWSWRSK